MTVIIRCEIQNVKVFFSTFPSTLYSDFEFLTRKTLPEGANISSFLHYYRTLLPQRFSTPINSIDIHMQIL